MSASCDSENPKSNDELVRLYEEFQKQWSAHKFRKGEYYDRFHYKLRDKLDLTQSEYQAGEKLAMSRVL